LRGGESVEISAEPTPPTLRAIPEEIPLDIIYEDTISQSSTRPAGMMVHARFGRNRRRGATEAHWSCALLSIMRSSRPRRSVAPRIVHRLDKQTSGLIIVGATMRSSQTRRNVFTSPNA